MTDAWRTDGTEPMILLAAGRREDDPAAVWTALLAVARGTDGLGAADDLESISSDTGAEPAEFGGPVAWAERGIDAPVERMRSALRSGHDQILVVPVAVLDGPDTPAGQAATPAWHDALADAVDRLRAAYPGAQIRDLGRSVGGPEAAALASVVAAPQNDLPAMLAGAIARGFGGDPAELARFITRLRTALPPATTIALRGSAVVGHRHTETTPFDGDGPGTSDLDVVAVGEDAVAMWVPEARLLGGINTLPLSDGADWVAPALDPARREAQAVIRRPLSIQAMAGWFLDLRAVVQRQPYVILHASS